MDKKTLYEKAEKAINQAFDVAKASIKVVSEKAGEAAHITKLVIEKASLEHKVSKKFAEIGHLVYDKFKEDSAGDIASDDQIKSLVEETEALESELNTIEKNIESERKKNK